MDRFDVPEDDMTPHEFSDDDAEAIISGFAPSDPELGAAFDDLRSAFSAVEPPTASGALTEFIVRGADPAPATAGAAAVPLVEPLVDTTPRSRSVFASLTAFAGTAIGKLCIGASVAAASVGGAAATGVDTPIDRFFDDDSTVETSPDLVVDDDLVDGDDDLDDADERFDDESSDDLDDATNDDDDIDLDDIDTDDDAADDDDSLDDDVDEDDSTDLDDALGTIDLDAINAVFERIQARWSAFLAIDDPTTADITALFADLRSLQAELAQLHGDTELDDFDLDDIDDLLGDFELPEVDLSDLDGIDLDDIFEGIDLDDIFEGIDLDDIDLDDVLGDIDDETKAQVDAILGDTDDLLDDIEGDIEQHLDEVDDILDDVDDLLDDIDLDDIDLDDLDDDESDIDD